MATKKASTTGSGDAENSEITYADAMAELEEIVAALEEDQPDIDDLANKVERASELIAACRTRLGATKERILEISESIDPR